MAGRGTVILGRLALSTHPSPRAHGHPLIDGCAVFAPAGRRDFGGLALRLPLTDFGVVVAWEGARVPDPQRLRRRLRRRRRRPVKHDLDAGLYLVDKEARR